MLKQSSESITELPMVTELMRIYQDGDPIRLMLILVDLVAIGQRYLPLTDEDYQHISQLNHMLGAIAQQQLTTK